MTPAGSDDGAREQEGAERRHRQQDERHERREEAVDQPAGGQAAGQGGAADRRHRDGGALRRDATIGEQRRQVRDRAVLGDRDREQDDDEDPEAVVPQALADGRAGELAAAVGGARPRPLADEGEDGRHADDDDGHANRRGRGPPAERVDQALRDRRQHHGPERAAAHAEGQGGAEAGLEPRRDRPRIGDLRRAHGDQAEDDEERVEVREVRRQQRERGVGAAEHDQARDDHAARTEPVEQHAGDRGADRGGHGGEAEGRRDGLARPGERLGDRLEEDAEGVDEHRGEADEDAEGRRRGDAPAFVADAVLVERGRPGAAAPLVGHGGVRQRPPGAPGAEVDIV